MCERASQRDLTALGFVQFDDFVYVKCIETDYIILYNHIDDIACGGSSVEVIEYFITQLSKTYTVKAEVDPTVYLSLQVERNRSCRYLRLHRAGLVNGFAGDYSFWNHRQPSQIAIDV